MIFEEVPTTREPPCAMCKQPEWLPLTMTHRQQSIFRLLSQGMTDDQVAEKLGVARRTVIRETGQFAQANGLKGRLQMGLHLGLLIAEQAAATASPDRDEYKP